MAPDKQFEQSRREVGEACMQARDLLGPVLESAEGVKADMISRGWTPHNAEAVAVAYVQGMLRSVLGGVRLMWNGCGSLAAPASPPTPRCWKPCVKACSAAGHGSGCTGSDTSSATLKN